MQSVFAFLLAIAVLVSGSYPSYPYPYAYGGSYYSGPLASPVLLPSGYLADTPEVAEAKTTHASRLALAAAAAAASPDYPAPVVLPSGYLADTPEVAAAKAVHFAELAKAGGGHSYYPAPYAPGYDGHYVPDRNGW